MKKLIRLDMTVEVDGKWCGDDAATDAVLAAWTPGIVEVNEECVLLVNELACSVVEAQE